MIGNDIKKLIKSRVKLIKDTADKFPEFIAEELNEAVTQVSPDSSVKFGVIQDASGAKVVTPVEGIKEAKLIEFGSTSSKASPYFNKYIKQLKGKLK